MTNGNGQTSGDAHNIATLTLLEAAATAAPSISNVTSSAITTNSATIGANVIANNAATTISVEYGLTTAYGSTMSTTPSTASGSAATAVSASLSSLTANTTYNYRVKAVNSIGTTYSNNYTFQTNSATTIVLLEDNGMVYPNPSANGKFILKTEGSSTIDKLNVFNATGALTPLIHIDQNKMEIDLSNEAAGLYYLSFELNGKRMIAKLIIEK